MRRRILSMMLAVCLVVSCVTACSGSADNSTDSGTASSEESSGGSANTSQDGSFKLGISINALDATTNRKMYESAQAYAKEQGIEVMATNAGDTTKQADDIENLVQSGCNAIIVQNADSSVCANAVKEASEAGVYIISEESGWMTGVSSMICINNFKVGAEMCNTILAEIGYTGKVILTGHNDHPTVRAHLNVFNAMCDEYSDIEVVNEVHTTYPGTTEVTYEGVSSALVQNPDVKAVICSQDLEALGAIQALKEADLYPDVKVIGHDGSLDVLNEIKDNDCCLLTVYPETVESTKIAVDAAISLMNGEEAEPYYEEPYTIVDDSNVDEYIEKATEDEETYASNNN